MEEGGVGEGEGGLSHLKWQTGASAPSEVMDIRHPQSPVWPSTSFHTDAPCAGPLRAESKQAGSPEITDASSLAPGGRDKTLVLVLMHLRVTFIRPRKLFI